MRTILGALLRRQGLVVTAVRDGEAGYAHAVAHKPSIICLDLMLPNTSGLEVCRRLRQTPETAQTPIVIVSARPYPQDRASAIEAGADAYLHKPCEATAVASTVRTLLWKSRDGRRAS
ncbi:MAG: response regulator [Acidobacteria bacterium]|nr:response regulator [Acidobacteriota bacterium]